MKGLKHGFGTYSYGNGDVYRGQFYEDKKTDQNCQLKFAKSQSVYQGGIKDGKYHGKGKLTQANGSYY